MILGREGHEIVGECDNSVDALSMASGSSRTPLCSIIRHFSGLGRFARFTRFCTFGAFGGWLGCNGGRDRRCCSFFLGRRQCVDGVENLLQIDRF
jgi:hypothetical protein